MSLPHGFLDELRSRTSLAQVVGRKVAWDMRKSNQGKGDMWAPCPFHQEKTASFHVDDRKGYYYCFGCQAKGDAISFVQETENVGFMEAVEILAREAGMTMPARDPKAQEKSDRRAQLTEVMERAVRFFRLQLKTAAGARARDYLAGRGLSEAALERWEIGLAPPGWQNLRDHLKAQGTGDELLLAAGLVRPSSKGRDPFDTFRNRIIFPIRDPRGRAIAFGGRALDPGEDAKYLNSPDTDLFDKGRVLFNHGPARAAAGKGQPLIVAEGYMDVIALVEAGFEAAVAPLGTAITETQLRMLWRIAPEPIIALDGDAAGLKAAMRVMDLALPLLEAPNALRFALMPEGKDPDDLIRAEGAGAVRKVLDASIPMVQLLWRRETEGRVFDSPERKAALDKALRERVRLIRDPSIRNHYAAEIKELRWQLFRAGRGGKAGGGKAGGGWAGGGRDGSRPGQAGRTPRPTPGAKSSILVAAGEAAEIRLHEAVILATVLTTPEVLAEFLHGLETMVCSDPAHERLRELILRHADLPPRDLPGKVRDAAGAEVEGLFAIRHVSICPAIRRPGDEETARLTLAEELAKLEARRGLEAEISEAAEDLAGLADEAVTWRLGQAAEARNRALRSQTEDRTEYDTGDNGARINRAERGAFDDLLGRIRFSRRRSRDIS